MSFKSARLPARDTARLFAPLARLLVTALLSSCTGTIDAPSGQGDLGQPSPPGGGPGKDTPGMGGGAGPGEPPPAAATIAPVRVRRLTHSQYLASARQLLGLADLVFDPPPPDPVGRNYATDARLLSVSEPLARHYREQAANALVALGDERLTAEIGCTPKDRTCGTQFVARKVRQAFRQPPAQEVVARYQGLFDMAAGSADALLPYRTVLGALLSAPGFLYRTEIGQPLPGEANVRVLTDHETATALSFDLTGAPPSPELLAMAERGDLGKATKRAEAIAQLLMTERASEQIVQFLEQWSDGAALARITKDAKTFPSFADLRPAMADELRRHFEALTEGAPWHALLTAPLPKPEGRLATFYGDRAGARLGVLSSGAFLSVHAKFINTSPTSRGLWIRDRLLCQSVPEPGENVNVDIDKVREEQGAGLTTRDVYLLHTKDPACASCHRLIDPLAFPLEVFDAAGRGRDREGGQAIEPAGEIHGTDVDGPVRGHEELVSRLGSSAEVRLCLASQAHRFFLGYGPAEDDPRRIALGAEVLANQGTLKAMLTRMLADESSFLRRTP